MIKLTRREREILPLLAMGKSANVIAQILNISESMIYTHSNNLVRKFDAANKTNMVVKAALVGALKMEDSRIKINARVEYAEVADSSGSEEGNAGKIRRELTGQ